VSAEFVIQCPTCLARLRVGSAKAAGAILPCPKCGSMVAIPLLAGIPNGSGEELSGLGKLTEVQEKEEAKQTAGDSGLVEAEQAADRSNEKAVGISDQKRQESIAEQGKDDSAEKPQTTGKAECENIAECSAESYAYKIRRIVFAVSALCVLVLAVWFWWIGHGGNDVPEPPDIQKTEEIAKGDLTTPTAVEQQEEGHASWVPSGADFFIYEDTSADLTGHDRGVVANVFALSEASARADQLLSVLGLKREVVAGRFISADARFATTVVVFQLKQDQRAEQLNVLGEPWENVGPVQLRQLAVGPERFAFAVVAENCVAIGQPEILKRLLSGDHDPNIKAILEQKLKSKPRYLMVIRPTLIRHRGLIAWFDAWPEIDQLWQNLWAGANLFIFSIERSEQQVIWTCEWIAKSPDDKDSLEKSVRGLLTRVLGYREVLASPQAETEVGHGGGDPDKEKESAKKLAELWLSCLDQSQVQVTDTSVLVTLTLPGDLGSEAGLKELGEIVMGEWRHWAEIAMTRRHGHLGKATSEYESKYQTFPMAAGGGVLLPPETRLSWIADLLPYLGREDWAKALQKGYSWNSAQNQEVTQRYLPDVTNPLLGPTQSTAGYFDSHVVGVTGVGEDSGELPPSHPRAGVFNYRHPVRRSDITDGLSNTIAMLGVENKRGPWAAGGLSTARGLTKPPYVNGSDGFGSAMPDGMLATMADGSVRFVRKDVDPRVLEQLATIAGGEPVTVDLLGSRASTAKGEAAPSGKNGTSGPVGVAAARLPYIPTMGTWRDPCGSSLETASDNDGFSDTSWRRRVAQVRFRASLALAISLLTQWSRVPVCVDPESAEWLRLTGNEEIQVEMQNVTFEDITRAMGEEVGLSLVPCKQSVVLVAADRIRDHVRYEFQMEEGESGTFPSSTTLEQVCDWFNEVSPGGFDKPAQVAKEGDRLVIDGPFPVVFEMRRMLEHRAAMGSTNERLDAEDEATISLNFFEPTRLTDIAVAINRTAANKVFFDWTSLARIDVTPDTEVSISATDEPLSGVLERLAELIQAQVHAWDDGPFVVCAPNRLTSGVLRIYYVGDILEKGTTPGQLREQLIRECAPESWADGGGTGMLIYDAPAQAFVVLNSAIVHREISSWLQKRREGQQGQ